MSLKPLLHRALTSPDVFACSYKVEDNGVQVGILILSEEFQPGLHFLYDLDSEQCYPLQIHSAISPQFKVILPYASISNAETD